MRDRKSEFKVIYVTGHHISTPQQRVQGLIRETENHFKSQYNIKRK